jgi:WD40 repeat protein
MFLGMLFSFKRVLWGRIEIFCARDNRLLYSEGGELALQRAATKHWELPNRCISALASRGEEVLAGSMHGGVYRLRSNEKPDELLADDLSTLGPVSDLVVLDTCLVVRHKRRVSLLQDGALTFVTDHCTSIERVGPNEVILGDADGAVEVRNVVTGECVALPRAHTEAVVRFAYGAKTLASLSCDGRVCLWDLPNKTFTSILEPGYVESHRDRFFFMRQLDSSAQGAASDVAVGDYLLAVARGTHILVYDIERGSFCHELPLSIQKEAVRHVRLGWIDKTLVAATSSGWLEFI